MAKQIWKAGNMVYPVPAVMVSLMDKNGKANIITVAWTGTVCSDPPMAYISVRKERYSHPILMETGEFVINLTTEKLAKITDFCGVRSGRDVDKFKEMNLTKGKSSKIAAPLIQESPVNIECKVKQVIELGAHDIFLAEVVVVSFTSFVSTTASVIDSCSTFTFVSFFTTSLTDSTLFSFSFISSLISYISLMVFIILG